MTDERPLFQFHKMCIRDSISGITPESLVIYDGMAHIRQGMAVTNTAQ